jgi:hypothetical protein
MLGDGEHLIGPSRFRFFCELPVSGPRVHVSRTAA